MFFGAINDFPENINPAKDSFFTTLQNDPD